MERTLLRQLRWNALSSMRWESNGAHRSGAPYLHYGLGRGGGVGRALGVGWTLGVGVGGGVGVGVEVGVGVPVEVGVGVAVGVGVGPPDGETRT